MAPGWTRLGSTALYARGKLTLREDVWRLPDGQEVVYPVLQAGVGVAVLPFVDDSRVLMVGQYRHLFDAVSWELPGGGALPGEEPLAAAQRELREEGGYRAERFELLYAAWGLTEDPLPADHDEFLERRIVPLEDAIQMARDGEITESFSKVALLQYALTRRPQ